MNIGFIGLGNMGYPMVTNLIAAGHTVWAYDREPLMITRAVEAGATSAQNVATVAHASDVIITMLQTGEQVSQVCLGKDGVFAHAKKDTLYVDCSSIDVVTARTLHEHAQTKHIAMLDAPVSGGVLGALNHTLTFMVGGEAAVLERARPVLAALSKTIVHTGPAGNGQAAKICNNLMLGISMIGVCEAFNLAEKLGLDAQALFDVSSQSSGQCWSLTSYAPVAGLVASAPSNRDFAPGFTARMMLKDLRLAQDAAMRLNATTPLGAEAAALYNLYCNVGEGETDFSGIIELLK